MEDRFGDVAVNGKWYRIQDGSYHSKDVSDFSPRASTPGGGVVYSQMDLYQVITQTDWRHGFGFNWSADPAGYADTVGLVNTMLPGVATLGTEIGPELVNLFTLQGTGNPYEFLTLRQSHDGYLLVALLDVMTNLVRTYKSNAPGTLNADKTWTQMVTGAITGYCDFYTNGKYTFCISAGRIQKCSDLSTATWTTTGVDADAKAYIWMMHHDGFVYAGKSGANEVYFDNTDDLSQLHGLPGVEDDPNVLKVGPPGRATLGAISYAGDLFFARADGLYRMDKDRSAARKVLDYTDQLSLNNFASMAVFNGSLIFPIRNQLYQWNGARVSPITPPRLSETYPYIYYTEFKDFFVLGSYFYCTARLSNGTATDVLVWDGVGWTRPLRDNDIYKMRFISEVLDVSGFYDNIYFRVGSSLRKLQLVKDTDHLGGPYPTTGQHSVIFSRIDAGFRRVIKSTPSIIVEGSSLLAGHRYLKFYYRLDNDSAWTAWGGVDGTTNVVDTTGVTDLTLPTPTTSTIEYFWIQFRVDFITDNSAYTPVLEGLSLRLLLRPDTAYGATFTIEGESEIQYATGRTDDRDAYGLLEDVKAARDSKAPVTFIDIWGDEYQAYITSVTDVVGEIDPSDSGAHPAHKHLAQVNVVEVK